MSFTDTTFLNDPAYASLGDSTLGLDGLSDLNDYALGLGDGGLLNNGSDQLGSLGSGLDDYGALGSSLGSYNTLSGDLDGTGLTSGVGGYPYLGAGLGYSDLGSGLDTLGGLGVDALGGGSAYMSNYDLGFDNIGSGLESLGWSSYDSGLDSLGDAALLGGAALAGGALGAGAGYYGNSNYDPSYVGGGLGGIGNSANLYGISSYDPGLGILGSSAFSFGAYDGYGAGSGLGSPTLRYSDLANYENRLYADQAISAAERQSLLADRLSWEALDDSARLSKWNSWDDGYRSRLGLSDGYWASRFGNQGGYSTLYDPMYAAYGWSQPSYEYGIEHTSHNAYVKADVWPSASER